MRRNKSVLNEAVILIWIFPFLILSCNEEKTRDLPDFWKKYDSDTSELDAYSRRKWERNYYIKGVNDFFEAYNYNYDFYIVYSYYFEFADIPFERELLLTIRAKDSMGLIEYSEIETKKEDSFFWEESNKKIANSHFLKKSFSKVVAVDSLNSIKKILDVAISHLHDNRPYSFGHGASNISYFNGEDFFLISLNFTSPEIMNQVDSIILNSPILDSLTSGFYDNSLLYNVRVRKGYVKRPDSLAPHWP